jgi:hypothetical protein
MTISIIAAILLIILMPVLRVEVVRVPKSNDDLQKINEDIYNKNDSLKGQLLLCQFDLPDWLTNCLTKIE